MANVTKLLDKPLKFFVLYSAAILVASIPIFFFVVDSIWLEELDENNEIIAERAKYNLSKTDFSFIEQDSLVRFWNLIHPNSRLLPYTSEKLPKDTIYTIYKAYPHSGYKDVDRFRVLETFVQINGANYIMVIESNVEETYETVGAIAGITAIIVFLLAVGFIFLNRLLSGTLWKPFRKTLIDIKQFELEEEKLPVFEKSNISEFEELHRYLLVLMSKNIEVFRSQKEFIENISHELQTPLAIVQNRLNLLIQDPGISKEQFRLSESAGKALSRAIKLNKSLILLAKIENRQFTEKEYFNPAYEIQDIMDLLRAEFIEKSIKVSLDFDKAVNLHCNKQLFTTLIQNMVTNALRYTPQKGDLSISVSKKEIVFSNTGNIALDEKRIFRRFVSMDKNVPGTGIGLALTKEICKLNNWKIEYSFYSQVHYFTITL